MIIESSAPTRVDLAGGTVDIWPLYLFHKDALTVNFAIDLLAKAKLSTRDDNKIILASNISDEEVSFDSFNDLHHNHYLSLFSMIIEFFQPKQGFRLEVKGSAPPGAGLSSSSALNIAVCGALNRLTKKGFSMDELHEIAKNIEGKFLKMLTGYQDYVPALYGGVNIVYLGMNKISHETIDVDIKELEDRLVLCYTGKPRNSGMSNWEMIKNEIEGRNGVHEKFARIVATAHKMKDALLDKQFDDIGLILGEEWENRKLLADTVSTDKIESLIALANKNGAISAKVCGAGGGGCVVFFVEKNKKKDVSNALSKESDVIDFQIVKKGLVINEA